VVGGP